MAKPKYEKPASLRHAEQVTKSDYDPGRLDKGGYPDPSDNGFVGVDPIYQNFANETEQPFLAEGGPEKKVESLAYADEVDTKSGATPEGESEAQDDAEDEEEETRNAGGSTTTSSTTPSTPQSPGA